MDSLCSCHHKQLCAGCYMSRNFSDWPNSNPVLGKVSLEDGISSSRSQPLRLLLHNTMEEARVHGFTSLYHGLRPLLLRDICFSSVYWSVYEHLRNATASLNISPVLQNLVAASMGGIMTSAAVTPFDLVKTRQQVLHTREPILQSLRMIEKEEGIRGLFRGLTPRVVQTIPSMSVMMIVYDGLNRLILQRQTSVVPELLFLCFD